MELLDKVTNYIINLSEKDFRIQLIAAISVITLIGFGATYYIYSARSSRVDAIKKLNTMSGKVTQLMAQNARLQREEDRVEHLLEKNKEFNIKSYFEQFCREHHINPEPNWDTTANPIEGNEKFEEITLAATFKNQTTKALVELLDTLDKNEIVYISELSIKKEAGNISFDLVMATKKVRHVVEK